MKIVLAGGSGYLGRTILNTRKDSNDEFIILTRKNPKKIAKLKSNYSSNVNFVFWDPTRITGEWTKQLENAEIIINLVGKSLASGLRWTKGVKKSLTDSRVVPTKTLINAITHLTNKPKLFIQISGSNYYDFSFEEINEDGKASDSFLGQLCVAWEEPVTQLKAQKTRIVIARLSPVIGEGSPLTKLLLLPYKLFIGGRYGIKGDQYFSWVSSKDFTRFIDFIIKNEIIGLFNLSSPNPIKNKEMNRIIGKKLKRPWFFHTPSWILKIVLGEKADLLIKSVRVISKKLPEAGFKFEYKNFEDAINDL